jgi:4-amino-4-deoxy-L-arabinose transferase-like glycosyltransferase
MRVPDRRFVAGLVAIAVGAVALRLVYVFVAVHDRIALNGDAETYHLLGRVMAAGHGYIRPREFLDAGEVVPTAEFPPLYPTLLAALDLVGIDSPTGQRVVGALLGGVTVVVIGLVGHALAGRWVGWTAALLAAVYPQLVVLDTSLLSEGLLVLLVATILLAVLHARDATGTARTWWWLAAGFLVGLAAVTRSEAILLVPLLLVPATHVAGDRRTWARTAAIACIGVIVIVGGWTIRNAVSLGHVQPFTNNSGTLLAGANCDEVYSGRLDGLWLLQCVFDVDDAAGVAGLDETETAAARRSAGLEYAREHASEVPRVAAVRVARVVGVWDVRDQLRFESLEGRAYHWLWAGWIGWLVLAPAAVAGAVIRRRRGELLWPLLVMPAIVLPMAALTYGSQRFRAIAEPSVILLAAVAFVALGGAIVERRAQSRGSTRTSMY